MGVFHMFSIGAVFSQVTPCDLTISLNLLNKRRDVHLIGIIHNLVWTWSCTWQLVWSLEWKDSKGQTRCWLFPHLQSNINHLFLPIDYSWWYLSTAKKQSGGGLTVNRWIFRNFFLRALIQRSSPFNSFNQVLQAVLHFDWPRSC
jgi:hypothetical protein